MHTHWFMNRTGYKMQRWRQFSPISIARLVHILQKMIFYLSGYTAVWKCTALFLLPATSTSSQLCRQTLHCDDAAGFKVYFPWLKDSFKIWNLHGTKMNHRLIINLVFCLRCHVDSFTHLSFIIALCGENTFRCRRGILNCNCLSGHRAKNCRSCVQV